MIHSFVADENLLSEEDWAQDYDEPPNTIRKAWIGPAKASLARLEKIKPIVTVYNLGLQNAKDLKTGQGRTTHATVSTKNQLSDLHVGPPLSTISYQKAAWGSETSISDVLKLATQTITLKSRPSSAKYSAVAKPPESRKRRPQSAKDPLCPIGKNKTDVLGVKGQKFKDSSEQLHKNDMSPNGQFIGWADPPAGLHEQSAVPDADKSPQSFNEASSLSPCSLQKPQEKSPPPSPGLHLSLSLPRADVDADNIGELDTARLLAEAEKCVKNHKKRSKRVKSFKTDSFHGCNRLASVLQPHDGFLNPSDLDVQTIVSMSSSNTSLQENHHGNRDRNQSGSASLEDKHHKTIDKINAHDENKSVALEVEHHERKNKNYAHDQSRRYGRKDKLSCDPCFSDDSVRTERQSKNDSNPGRQEEKKSSDNLPSDNTFKLEYLGPAKQERKPRTHPIFRQSDKELSQKPAKQSQVGNVQSPSDQPLSPGGKAENRSVKTPKGVKKETNHSVTSSKGQSNSNTDTNITRSVVSICEECNITVHITPRNLGRKVSEISTRKQSCEKDFSDIVIQNRKAGVTDDNSVPVNRAATTERENISQTSASNLGGKVNNQFLEDESTSNGYHREQVKSSSVVYKGERNISDVAQTHTETGTNASLSLEEKENVCLTSKAIRLYSNKPWESAVKAILEAHSKSKKQETLESQDVTGVKSASQCRSAELVSSLRGRPPIGKPKPFSASNKTSSCIDKPSKHPEQNAKTDHGTSKPTATFAARLSPRARDLQRVNIAAAYAVTPGRVAKAMLNAATDGTAAKATLNATDGTATKAILNAAADAVTLGRAIKPMLNTTADAATPGRAIKPMLNTTADAATPGTTAKAMLNATADAATPGRAIKPMLNTAADAVTPGRAIKPMLNTAADAVTPGRAAKAMLNATADAATPGRAIKPMLNITADAVTPGRAIKPMLNATADAATPGRAIKPMLNTAADAVTPGRAAKAMLNTAADAVTPGRAAKAMLNATADAVSPGTAAKAMLKAAAQLKSNESHYALFSRTSQKANQISGASSSDGTIQIVSKKPSDMILGLSSFEDCNAIQQRLAYYGIDIKIKTLERALYPPSGQTLYYELDANLPESYSAGLLSHPRYWLPREYKILRLAEKQLEAANLSLWRQKKAEVRKLHCSALKDKVSKKAKKKWKHKLKRSHSIC